MALAHLLFTFVLLFLSYGPPETLQKPIDFRSTCYQIGAAISSASQAFFPPAPEYSSDIFHAASSSSELSACSVEPGSAEDVSKILRILGSGRTPFAVKGGGHATNRGFSSTRGVQISMSRFNKSKVNYKSGTVEVGAGLTWDQVYAKLEPTGVNVVGARAAGVGVAGLTLGGGYSFKTSQYGLAIDNVVEYELVLPNGTVINVTSKDNDLWFALRGGCNNYGIVTKFTLKSHSQTDVWGGFLSYAESESDAIREALFKFQQQEDTKAQIIPSMIYASEKFFFGIIFFYDAPTPSGIFNDFMEIPATGGETLTRSFSDLVLRLSRYAPNNGPRGIYDDAPVAQFSPTVFNAMVNQIKSWGARLGGLDRNISLGISPEPFDTDFFSHGSASAYPPDRSHAIFPSLLSVQWSNTSLDQTMASALRQISDAIHTAALSDGQNVSQAAKYPNYAIFDTPMEDMYGGNMERLRQIRAAIDPKGVMGLAGGWKF